MKFFLTVLLFFPFLSLHAQTTNDKSVTTKHTYVIKFNPGDSIIYDNNFTNGEELQRLYDMLELYRPEIERKEVTVFVDGYCASEPSQPANRLLAVIRSNCVKSVLIRQRGMKENYFKTTNHTVAYKGETDVEVLTLEVPDKSPEPVQLIVADKPEIVVADVKEIEKPGTVVAEIKETELSMTETLPEKKEPLLEPVAEQPQAVTEQHQPVVEPTPVVIPPAQVEELSREIDEEAKAKEMAEREKIVKSYFEESAKKAQPREGVWSLRANLLYRLANMLNAGAEWKRSDSFGILLNGGWSGTEWDGGNRKLRLWMVSPEVRWYLGEKHRWFLGLEGHMGKFNIRLSDTGYQGNFMGGGLTTGYRVYLSRYFDMDFSLGLGYIRADYDEYNREGCESVQLNETRIEKDIFGPTQVGVSLIWKLK